MTPLSRHRTARHATVNARVLSGIALTAALTAGCTGTSGSQAVLFEGARLISGSPDAEPGSSAFLVEDGQFTAVGPLGSFVVPEGARRVTLAGKTVMPAWIDTHNHIGWSDQTTGVATPTSFTRSLVIDHLERYAYFGAAAAMSLGLDRWNVDPDMPYQLRHQIVPNAARFLTTGRGIAATPMAGPPSSYRLGVPFGAATPDEGRQHVRDLEAKGVELVKIWVDDRQGTVPKLAPDVVAAIIDEAHSRHMRVVAHIFHLADAKQLLRAGVDGFAHSVRDLDVDDEYLSLLRSHPTVWIQPNLPVRTLNVEDTAAQFPWLASALPPRRIAEMRQELATRTGDTPSELFAVQCRNLRRIHDAGAIIALGTDGNADIGWGGHLELADMVHCGLTPHEAIVAATSVAAAVLKLEDLGTLEPGKSADFVILDADPLEDITNTRRILDVYQRGAPIDRTALSRRFTTERSGGLKVPAASHTP